MKVIDLSQPIYRGMKVYPGDPEVEVKVIHTISKQGWILRKLTFGNHTGTHVDAFSHMDEKGKTLDQIPLKRFCGPTQIVDITNDLPQSIGLIFKSGKLTVKDFKKLSQAYPPFIATGNNCELELELEKKLLQHEIITFTDLINLDKLPTNKQFMFYGFPLKISNGDGSPVRAVAILN